MTSKPKPIKISVTSGVKGQAVTLRNRSNGDVINTILPDTGKLVVDLQNLANGYSDEGEVIDIMVSGERVGANSVTTSGDSPQTVTVSTAAVSTSVVRGVR